MHSVCRNDELKRKTWVVGRRIQLLACNESHRGRHARRGACKGGVGEETIIVLRLKDGFLEVFGYIADAMEVGQRSKSAPLSLSKDRSSISCCEKETDTIRLGKIKTWENGGTKVSDVKNI